MSRKYTYIEVRKMRNEREITRELICEMLEDENINELSSEIVKKWVVEKIEQFIYKNYKYRKRKISYLQYVHDLYFKKRGINTVKMKVKYLLDDLRRTQKALQKRKNTVVKEGTRAWAAVHLPPPTQTEFLPCFNLS